MSFIGGRLPRIKEDDEDSWKPGQVGTLGTELNEKINKWISENTWERIPEQYRDAIIEGVQQGAYSGSHFADGTPKPIKSEWLMNLHPAVLKYKGARSVLSRGLNINPGLVDKGAIVGGTGKTLYNKLNQSTAAHQTVHQAGQNVRRNVDRIQKDVGWAKDQIQYATGDKLRPLTKKPSVYTDVEEIIDGPRSLITRAKKIHEYHAGGISFAESMRRARELPDRSSSKYWYQDSKLALRKGGITDPQGGQTDIKYSTGVEPTINWNNYGYTPGTEPTQVRNITIPELKTQVATSLDAFYKKTQEVVQSRYGSKASSKEIRDALKNQPQYWTNPVTQKIYRVSYKTGLNKRYTLKPINRQYLEKQQSTAVQKQIAGQYQKGLQKKNVDLKQAHNDRYDILENELRSVQATIADYNQRGIRGPNYDAAIAKQNEINTQINNLEEGRWYTEHNVYLQSEKARNYVLDNSGVRINDSKEFQLGNIANQTPRLENRKNPDTLVFKELKDKLERVLDETSDEYFSYPNYIVNSNPRLSGGREGIIRIEYSPIEWQPVPGTNNMRPVLTDFKVKGGILSGKSVIEIDTKDIDFIRNNLSTPEDIRNWLSSQHGINPVSQDQSFPKEGFEIRLSKSPLVSRAEQIKEFQRLAKEVQAGRKTWAEVFNEAGYEIVPQTGKGKIKLTDKQLQKRAIAAKTKKTKQARRKTKAQERLGQETMTKELIGDPEYQNLKRLEPIKDILNRLFPD